MVSQGIKRSRPSVLLIAVILSAMALNASCGGGSITFTPGGGNPPPATKSPVPNAASIYAGPHMTIPAFTIQGAPGTAAPNAMMFYRDSTGITTQGPAGADGSFEITNFPVGWDIQTGHIVEVTQVAPGMTESDPAVVAISP